MVKTLKKKFNSFQVILLAILVAFGVFAGDVLPRLGVTKALTNNTTAITADTFNAGANNTYSVEYTTPGAIVQAGFQAQTGTSPVHVLLKLALPGTPIVVASRNWFGQNEEMIRVYNVTNASFDYQGDGDTWINCGSGLCGVYWIAIYGSIGNTLQSGFNGNYGTSPVAVTFPQSFPGTPIVVASRNWFGQNEEMIRVYDVTKDGFKYQGDGDTWINNCGSDLCGVYWIAINGSIGNILQSGFNGNYGASPVAVTFPQSFPGTPIVVASRNWFGQNEEMIRVYDVTKDGFKYQGDGDTWINCGSGLCGVYWIAINPGINFFNGSQLAPPYVASPQTQAGPSNYFGYQLKSILPSGVTFVSASPLTPVINGSELIWDNLPANSMGTIQVTVSVPNSLCGQYLQFFAKMFYQTRTQDVIQVGDPSQKQIDVRQCPGQLVKVKVEWSEGGTPRSVELKTLLRNVK